MTEPPAANPYPGPRPFLTGENLYGRDREVTKLFYLLSAERIVVLHSPSGAGKSSLLNAGLVPRLQAERFDVWPTIRLSQPAVDGGNRFVRSAVSSLEEGLPEKRRRPSEAIAGMTVPEYVAGRPRRPGAPPSVVLIFDQFEEILTLDPIGIEERREFFRQLGETLENQEVWALFALREDYLGALDPYRDDVPTRLSNTFRVDLLAVDAATDAIASPARDAGREFAPEAARRLANELAMVSVQQPDGSFEETTGIYVEPLQLQVVCRRLWDGLPAETRTIGVENLLASGDVDNALAAYYDDSVAEIAGADTPKQRGIREWFGDRLITPGGIRSQVLREQGTSGGLDNDSVDRLVATHLVRSEERDGKTWFELAHDRLVAPVRKSNDAWLEGHLHPMQRQAALWEREGRPDSLLLRGQELEDAEAWAHDNPTSVRPVETDLLTDSANERQAERRKHRRLLMIIGVGALLLAAMAGVTIYALGQRSEAQTQASLAKTQERLARTQARRAEAGEYAARAVAPGVDPQLALVLAARSVGLRQTREGEDALRQALLMPHEVAILPSSRPLNAASFSADGKFVATASDDGTARIWDASSGRLVRPLHSGGRILAVSFSPDGKLLLAGGSDQTARIYRVKDGNQLHVLRHGGPVGVAFFSSDGKLAVTGSADGTVRLWRSTTGKPALSPIHVGVPVERVALSRNGRLLVAVSKGRARVYDAATGRLRHELDERGITTASFSRDGSMIVTGSNDSTARIWSAKTGKQLRPPLSATLQGRVTSASFGPSAQLVVTTSMDGSARVWRVADGKLVHPLLGQVPLVDGAWSGGNGEWFVTVGQDGILHVWRPAGGTAQATLQGHQKAVVDASFNPKGDTIVTASRDETARIWDPETAPGLRVLKDFGPPLASAAWGPDGSVAVAIGDEVLVLNARRQVVRRLKQDGPAVGAEFSRDGSLLVTAGGRVVQVRRASNFASLHTMRQASPITDVALSKDGSLVATGGTDRRARIWRTTGGKPFTVVRQGSPVTAVGLSPDNRLVVTGGTDDLTRIWDVATGKPRGSLGQQHKGAAITSAVFSPKGGRVLTASLDQNITVWDLRTKNSWHEHAHSVGVYRARYSPDGRWIVTSGPTTAGLWDAVTHDLILYLHGHEGKVDDAVFSPDGRHILTAGHDGTARVYDCLPCGNAKELLEAARKRLARLEAPLTPAERRNYLPH